MYLLYDDDSCMLIADLPSICPKMPGIMEQEKIGAVVRDCYPSALGGIQQLVRIGGAQTSFGRGREDNMTICTQRLFENG